MQADGVAGGECRRLGHRASFRGTRPLCPKDGSARRLPTAAGKNSSARSEPGLRRIGPRREQGNDRALQVAELHRAVAPGHHLRRLRDLDLVLHAIEHRIDILDPELDDRGAVGACLGAAGLEQRDDFGAADGKRRGGGEDLGELRRQPLGRQASDHLVERDHEPFKTDRQVLPPMKVLDPLSLTIASLL